MGDVIVNKKSLFSYLAIFIVVLGIFVLTQDREYVEGQEKTIEPEHESVGVLESFLNIVYTGDSEIDEERKEKILSYLDLDFISEEDLEYMLNGFEQDTPFPKLSTYDINLHYCSDELSENEVKVIEHCYIETYERYEGYYGVMIPYLLLKQEDREENDGWVLRIDPYGMKQ